MTFRAVVSMSALSLAVSTFAIATDGAAPPSKPAWISFAEAPVETQTEQEWHVRATKNVDSVILKIISAFVARSTERRLVLVSRSDANLDFRTDQFLVAKIAANEVTLTTGTSFPTSVTDSLAKRLRKTGYVVEVVAPDVLLEKHHADDSLAPEFVVPHGAPSRE